MPDTIRLFPPEDHQVNCPRKPREQASQISHDDFTLVVGHPQQLDDLSEIWARTNSKDHTWEPVSVPPFPKSGLWRLQDWLNTPAGEAIKQYLWQPGVREVVFIQDDLRYLDIVAVRLCPTRRRLRYTVRADIAERELGCRARGWHRLNRESVPLPLSVIKRTTDIAGGLVLLPFVLAISLVAIPLLAITNRGQVFERRLVVGLHGQPFVLWSFASPDPQSSAEIVDLTSDGSQSGGTQRQATSQVAELLQKLGLGMMPGIFRVLSGQMSLTGPKAISFSEALQVHCEDLLRLKRKPGLF